MFDTNDSLIPPIHSKTEMSTHAITQEYFQPNISRKIRIFSLGRKNNILIEKKKSVHENSKFEQFICLILYITIFITVGRITQTFFGYCLNGVVFNLQKLHNLIPK